MPHKNKVKLSQERLLIYGARVLSCMTEKLFFYIEFFLHKFNSLTNMAAARSLGG